MSCAAIVLGGLNSELRAADEATRHRRGTLAGHVQPVLITAPEGTRISIAANGGFSEDWPTPSLVGLQVAHVYRLRAEFSTLHGSGRVYPTIQLLDHLFPPAGRELEFPVPIELTAEDLRLAAEGHFITRVIYVEDPLTALSTSDDPQHPRWFDAGPGVDPLATAREYGRPVAILRMGGRVIDESVDLHGTFLGTGGGVIHYRSPANHSGTNVAPPEPVPAEPATLPPRQARAVRNLDSRYAPAGASRPQ